MSYVEDNVTNTFRPLSPSYFYIAFLDAFLFFFKRLAPAPQRIQSGVSLYGLIREWAR